MRYIFYIFLIALGSWITFFGYEFWNSQNQHRIDTTRTSIITEFEAIENLETEKMTIQKIIEWKKDMTDLIPGWSIDDDIEKFLFEDKLVMEVEWVVIAGFDLSKITWNMVVVHADSSATIFLPPVQILHTYLTEETNLFARSRGLFTKWKDDFETAIRNEAMIAIEKEALQAGILDKAEENAKKVLEELFATVGVKIRSVEIENVEIQE